MADKRAQIFASLPKEFRSTPEEIARQHNIDVARFLFFLRKWQEENIASFSQEGDMILFKKGNLPATIPKEEKKVIIHEEKEEKKLPEPIKEPRVKITLPVEKK